MICKICKTNNEEGSKFCISCGSPIIQSTRTCPNGHIYDSILPSCPYCPSPSLQNKIGMKPGGNEITSTFSSDSSKTKVMMDPVKGKKTVIVGGDSDTGGGGKLTQARKIVGWLVTFSNKPEGDDFRLFEGRNQLSSSSDTDITINDPAVSSPHCMILYRAGKLLIKDELSTNGTFLNGEIIEEAELKDNDVIKVGTTELKLRTIN
ncbi:MAG: FHA domain-containing protein [Ignavibacteria bacterium]|nr:FHA domain-containing protein [Ignavibacteria bacterium]